MMDSPERRTWTILCCPECGDAVEWDLDRNCWRHDPRTETNDHCGWDRDAIPDEVKVSRSSVLEAVEAELERRLDLTDEEMRIVRMYLPEHHVPDGLDDDLLTSIHSKLHAALASSPGREAEQDGATADEKEGG